LVDTLISKLSSSSNEVQEGAGGMLAFIACNGGTMTGAITPPVKMLDSRETDVRIGAMGALMNITANERYTKGANA
jgi:hypothetical protein